MFEPPIAANDDALVPPQRDRWRSPIGLYPLLVAYGCLYAIGLTGGILAPRLVKNTPELLLAMNSQNRNLLLAIGADVSVWGFFGIAALRLFAADPVCYLLGRGWGDRAFDWVESNGGIGSFDWIIRWFSKAPWLAILIAPNNVVLFLAGRTAYPVRRVIALDIIGTFARLGLIWWASKPFRDELNDVVNWVSDNQRWLIIGLLVISVLNTMRKQKRPTARR
jgi:membrane protein DedA with SNARE-associated domain